MVADELEEIVDNGFRGMVAVKTGKEYFVGKVFDRLKMLNGKDITQYARVADISGVAHCEQAVAQCLGSYKFQQFIGMRAPCLLTELSVINYTFVGTNA